MKILSSKPAALMTDIICCILLGASACAIVLPSAGLEVGYGDCMLLMAADLLLVFLFTRKWWLFPAFAIGAVAITLLITTILDVNQDFWTYIEGFIDWCAASYPNTPPYSLNGSIIIVQLAMALPAAILTYMYYRRLFFFPILPLVALALLIWTYANAIDVFWPILVMLLTVIFLSIAKMTGNYINRTLPERDRISSALLVITAMVLTPVIVFLSFTFSPKEDGDWKFKGLVNLVEDFGDYFGWGEEKGPTQGSFNIGISGFSPLENQLGGNVVLDNTTVMKVKTDTPFFLTGAVYNTYDGQRWYDTGSLSRYRMISFLWQGKRREVFGLDKPYGDNRARELFTQLTTPAAFEISYMKSGRTLFSAGQVQYLESNAFDTADVFFNRQSELFTETPRWSFRYKLHTVVFDRSKGNFDSNMAELEALTQNTRDNGFEAIRNEYLQLPDSLPGSVYEQAEEITQGCTTPYEKAEAIEQWLAENCTYSLSPGGVESTDFVAYFLEKREGYCVYYASAMTVLARCSGLPARYVTGYALKSNPQTTAYDSFVATNATAHAWTEIYFKGIGWLTFDPTGWNFNENAIVEPDSTEQSNQYIPIPTPAPDVTPNAGSLTEQGGGMSEEVKVMLLSLMGLALALILFTSVRFILLLLGANGYYRRLCRKYDTAGERLSACYRKLIRQVSFLGVRQQAGDTITSFAHNVDSYLGSREMTDICDCVIRMRFGLQEPKESDVINMCAFSAGLEKRLRSYLGISGYIWRRLIRGR